MTDGEFRAVSPRHPADAVHYVGFIRGVRVSLLFRPDLSPREPWGVQFHSGETVTWHETVEAAADYARARPLREVPRHA